MPILNKKKYFFDLTYTALNLSMKSINEMNVVITKYKAKPFIEKDKELFVLSTHLFTQFFIESVLQHKYWEKYKDYGSMMLDLMIEEICNRLKIKDIPAVTQRYLEARAILDDIGRMPEEDVPHFFAAAMVYIQATFGEEYTQIISDAHIGYLYADVSQVFAKLLADFDKVAK